MLDSGIYKASLKKVSVAPRKARLVVDLIRGKAVSEALDILRLTNKRVAPMLLNLVKSAISNAKEKATVDVDSLVISTAYVNEGTTMKRFLPRAQGRATQVRKRSSKITIYLSEV